MIELQDIQFMPSLSLIGRRSSEEIGELISKGYKYYTQDGVYRARMGIVLVNPTQRGNKPTIEDRLVDNNWEKIHEDPNTFYKDDTRIGISYTDNILVTKQYDITINAQKEYPVMRIAWHLSKIDPKIAE